MESGGIEGVLENRGREKNFRTDGGASGAGIDFERAAELGHAFSHAGDADAEAGLAAMGGAVCRDDHATAGVGGFGGGALWLFAKADFRAPAAGGALDVGKTLLRDA